MIVALTTRGREAARRLVRRFAHPPEQPADLSWDSHRWTRYRSSIAAIAALVEQFKTVYQAEPDADGDRTYGELLARPNDAAPRAYQFERNAQRDLAEEFTGAINDAAAVAEGATPEDLAEGAPRPEPVARIVPRA